MAAGTAASDGFALSSLPLKVMLLKGASLSQKRYKVKRFLKPVKI